MPEPRVEEYADVVGALAATAPCPGGFSSEGVIAALARPPAPERVNGIEAAIERDADEAWSLAVAFLGDEAAAREALMGGFVTLGRAHCVALSLADTLRAVAASALEVWRLLNKAGSPPEVVGASMPPAVRLGILLRAGFPGLDLALEGTGELDAALVAAFPRAGHEQGEELCRLLAREKLGLLGPGQAAALEALRRAHPTSAALIRERYAEVAEVPLLVATQVDQLASAVKEQLAHEREQRERVGAVRLRITVSCCFCHDGLAREEAVFCSRCLAPHHQECFMTHGRCSAAGCGERQVVRPVEAAASEVPARPASARPPATPSARRRRRALTAGAALLLAGGAVAAWTGRGADGVDPELLRAAEMRAAAEQAERERRREEASALERRLDQQRISVNFQQTPFHDCIEFLRDVAGLNFVVSHDAGELVSGENVRVTLRLSDISLKHALRLVLASNEQLAYRCEQGLIKVVTTAESEESFLEVYDVEDIVTGATRKRGGYWLDADKVIELLGSMGVDPEQSAEIQGGALILRAGERHHETTRRLLRFLREGEPRSSGSAARPGWIERYEKALQEPMSVAFVDSSLVDVVAELQVRTGINFVIDPRADAEERAVTLRLRDVSGHDVLRLLLEQTGLAMRYESESLIVCLPESAKGEYELRILDTRDLETWLEGDQLREVVVDATGSEMWDDPARIDSHNQQLIVNQTPLMHEEVERILGKLRVSRAQRQ